MPPLFPSLHLEHQAPLPPLDVPQSYPAAVRQIYLEESQDKDWKEHPVAEMEGGAAGYQPEVVVAGDQN